jgi:hypothetical protein
VHIRSSAATATIHVNLSSADLLRWNSCPRKRCYEDSCHAAPCVASASAVFAHCVEDAVYPYLLAWKLGTPLPDPAEVFDALWHEATSESEVHFVDRQGHRVLRRLGRSLLRKMPSAWERSELDIVTDDHCEPVIQKPLRLDLGSRRGVQLEFCGCVGVLAQPQEPADPTGLVLLEVSPALRPGAWLARRADRLTGAQLLADAHRARWGDRVIARTGFWDLIATCGEPRRLEPVLGRARTPSEVAEYGEALWWMAERAGQAHRTRADDDACGPPASRCPFAGSPASSRRAALNPVPPPLAVAGA